MILLSLSIFYLPTSLRIKQTIWTFFGLFLTIFFSKVKWSKIEKYSLLSYIIGIILLIIVLILNKFTNGSRGWIDFKIISIQPSELMKIALILITLKYFKKLKTWQLILIYLLPMILIFLEPDTGAVIIEGIMLTYFLVKKLSKKQLLKLSTIFFKGTR